ncbi:MAG: exopolysaccharide biosynthesis protein [Cyanobacteria bacterium P01_D01_bin.105]
MARLSVELQRYFLNAEDNAPHRDVTLNEVLEIAGERTFGFLFVLLSIPSALPIPAPGYSTPFGIVMFLLAVQLMVGRDQPWLPEKFRKKGFARAQVQDLITKGMPWLKRIETVSQPRLTPLCTSRLGQAFVGGLIALASISMMLPFPLTNTLPAMGIFVAGLGLSDDDGLLSLAGVTICMMGVALTSTLMYLVFFVFGFQNMDKAAEFIKERIKP